MTAPRKMYVCRDRTHQGRDPASLLRTVTTALTVNKGTWGQVAGQHVTLGQAPLLGLSSRSSHCKLPGGSPEAELASLLGSRLLPPQEVTSSHSQGGVKPIVGSGRRMGREEDAAAAGWLRYGEVHCGQGTRTGAKSGTSSPGQGLELGGMGWEGAEASWVVARLGHKSCQQLVYLFPPCLQVAHRVGS